MGIKSSRNPLVEEKKKRRKKGKKKKAVLGPLLKHSHRLWAPVVTPGRTSPQLTCPPSFPLPHLGWHLAPAPRKEAGSFPGEAVPALPRSGSGGMLWISQERPTNLGPHRTPPGYLFVFFCHSLFTPPAGWVQYLHRSLNRIPGLFISTDLNPSSVPHGNSLVFSKPAACSHAVLQKRT